jgi:hypothetical protein
VPAFFMPDTNVLVHGRFLDEVDWPKVLGVESVALIVPMVVIEELDKLKHSGESRRVKERADKVAKKLKSLRPTVLSDDGALLRPGVTVRLLKQESRVGSHADLDPAIADSRLIAAARDFGQGVKVLTFDVKLVLRCDVAGVLVVDLPDEVQQPVEADPLERENARLKQELAAERSRRPDLRVGAEVSGVPTNEASLKLYRVRSPNEDEYPRRASDYTKRRIDEIQARTRSNGWRLPAPFMSQEELFFRENLPQVEEEYSAFLRKRLAWEQVRGRSFPLAVKIGNVGTARATNVCIVFRVRDGIELRPQFLAEPQRMGITVAPNPPGQSKIEIRIPSIAHYDEANLSDLWITIPDDFAGDRIPLDVSLRADELREPNEMSLLVSATWCSAEPFTDL